MSPLELLSPAKDLATGLAAINCGADAVYIGAPKFGAREAAGNSLADIEALASYAHKYWARVYVTLNTLLRDDELDDAVRLAHAVQQAGADALIIQDAGLLECDLPPLPLFASTQMHNHTPERVTFLEQVGFKRVILARELSLEQIKAIRAQTTIELETFVHGALCVCYSGQCQLSYALGGRSGNRGECAQPCRRSYSLVDSQGRVLVKDRYLLSIRDLNLGDHLRELAEAGVTSFKIEGRLKDRAYVMNVVAHYRQALDALGAGKASSGHPLLDFSPDPAKTFNRGFTSYFFDGRRNKIGSPATPKMAGEPIGRIVAVSGSTFTLEAGSVPLHPGDGICFYPWGGMESRQPDSDGGLPIRPIGDLMGTQVNGVEGDVVHPDKMYGIQPGLMIHRNHDHAFITRLNKSRAVRKIEATMTLAETPDGFRLEMRDEDGVVAMRELACEKVPAEKPDLARATIEKQLAKLGETEFACSQIDVWGVKILITPEGDQTFDKWAGTESDVTRHRRSVISPTSGDVGLPSYFLPVSALNELRRGAVEALRAERLAKREQVRGSVIRNEIPYPDTELTYQGNVLNKKAAQFYRRHGVTQIEPAAEIGLDMHGRTVMTTKYCLKYQLDACPREGKEISEVFTTSEVYHLVDEDGRRLRLQFDCATCQMQVIFEGSGDRQG